MISEHDGRLLELYGRRGWMTREEALNLYPRKGAVVEKDWAKAELPQHWTDLLSEFWGARSLHGAVFREPRGVVFWHCDRCRVPANPSGTRTWDGAARTARQVAKLCEAVRLWREAERDRFIQAIRGSAPPVSLRVLLSLGDVSKEMTGATDDEIAKAAAELINGGAAEGGTTE